MVAKTKYPRVSVVIATYNRPEMLYRTVYSLIRQQDLCYEILVSVDDDFDVEKKTTDVLDSFIKDGHPIRYFMTNKYKRGEGFSAPTYPFNVGIREARGEILLICGSDIISVTNTIQQHRLAHQGCSYFGAVSTVHAITFSVQNKIDTFDWKNKPQSLLFKGSCYKMFSGMGVSYTNQYPKEDASRVCYHWLVSFRTENIVKIGGFDEDFYGRFACADDDFVDRVKRSGVIYKPRPDIIGVHQHHMCPERLTDKESVQTPPVESGHTLFKIRKNSGGIVRNTGHVWGQYPRDMENLPAMSVKID